MNDTFYIAGDRNKGKQGLVRNYIYYMKCMKEWDRKLFYATVLVALPMVVFTLLQTLLPSVLVQGLEEKLPVGSILLQVGLLSAALWLLGTLAGVMQEYGYTQQSYFPLYFMKKYVGKIMRVDYDKLDEKEFRNLSENVWNAGLHGRGITYAMGLFPELAVKLLSVAVYGVLLGIQNILLVLAVMVSLSANLCLLGVARKKHRQYFGQISRHARRAEYISGQSMDSAAGKDIRIYRMLDLFLKKYDQALESMGKLYGNIHKWYLLRNMSGAFLEFLRDGLAFGLLVYLLASGRITAAGFVFCIGAVSRFSICFEMLLRIVMDFNSVNTTIGYVRDFLGTGEEWKPEPRLGKERMEEMGKHPVELTLKDVCFSYPGGREILSHVNLTIKPGEKLALIGLNGAGKTTLVKLICGFYQPTQGEILLNGIPIREYGREEYYSLIAVLFQDSTLLPATLDENLTGVWEAWGQEETAEGQQEGEKARQEAAEGRADARAQGQEKGNGNRKGRESVKTHIDRERLDQILAFSGFQEKYENLPKKGRTPLVKKLNEGAVDFSGGEMQKLLFARAIYKDVPLVIMDEPTAALDPEAECEVFAGFDRMVGEKTAIYISHRLASCRFCQDILVFDGGQVVQRGSHEELAAVPGLYQKLWDAQAQYYKGE